MAETRKNRLSPPLMHVFRAAYEARDARDRTEWSDDTAQSRNRRAGRTVQRIAITEAVLRREVARDVENLMNAIAIDATLDLDEFPQVANSILNYGFPDIANRTIDELAGRDLQKEIEQALRRYEPRLAPDTLKIQRDASLEDRELKVRYLVNADLFCNPVNVPVQFTAEVELETGKIMIDRLRA